MEQICKIIYFFLFAFMFSACVDEEGKISTDLQNAGIPEFSGDVVELNRTATSIEVKATLSKENGTVITERGFCWAVNATPTIQDNKETIPYESGDFEYSFNIEGLNKNTSYHIRAYAKNAIGIEYSNEIIIITTPGLGSVVTKKTQSGDVFSTSATVEGLITNPGEGEIKERGIYYWPENKIVLRDSVISADGTLEYSCHLTDLTVSTKYCIQAYVKNDFGIVIGNIDTILTRNGLPDISCTDTLSVSYTSAVVKSSVSNSSDTTVQVIKRGFVWGISSNPLVGVNDTIGCDSGVGDFTATIDGLVAQQLYYVRSFVVTVRDTVYSDEIYFYTQTDVPTVTTEAYQNMINGSIKLNGKIQKNGKSAFTDAGICWSLLNMDPKITDNVLPNLTVNSDSTFSVVLTNLKPNEKYFYRAYATNAEGIGYGNDVEVFNTPSVFTTGLASFTGTARIKGSTAYFAIGSDLYLYGGDLGSTYTNELLMYSISTGEWLLRWPNPEGGAKWSTAFGYREGAFVFGGMGNDLLPRNIYQYYSPTNDNKWFPRKELPDSAYLSLGYVQDNNSFIIGGRSDTVKNSVWFCENGPDEWIQRDSFPVRQYGGIGVVINNVAYVGMGRDDLDICNGTLWTSHDLGITWDQETVCPIYRGGILGGVACNSKIYVIDESYYILEYNPVTNIWIQKSQIPSTHQSFSSIYVYSGKIYIGVADKKTIIIYDPSWDN
jgi:hypothetical protein